MQIRRRIGKYCLRACNLKGNIMLPYHTGIKLWLSDQTSDHHKFVTEYYGNNRHYLANYFESRFLNKIDSKTLKSYHRQVFKDRAF